jgi:hypothetical protein
MADLFEAGKVPKVRKIPALLRLDGLNRTIVAVEKNTRSVRLFLQNQSVTVVAQPGELLDEVVFAHALERREAGDLGVVHVYLARPAAAGGATLTFVKDRHCVRVMSPVPFRQACNAGRRGMASVTYLAARVASQITCKTCLTYDKYALHCFTWTINRIFLTNWI